MAEIGEVRRISFIGSCPRCKQPAHWTQRSKPGTTKPRDFTIECDNCD